MPWPSCIDEDLRESEINPLSGWKTADQPKELKTGVDAELRCWRCIEDTKEKSEVDEKKTTNPENCTNAFP